jgi:hypothetical protein
MQQLSTATVKRSAPPGSRFAPHNGDVRTIDRRFLRRLQTVDKVSSHDKKLLLGTIDAFLAKIS